MRSEYAVVLYFDQYTNSIFQNMINKAAEVTDNHYMTENRIPPHLTIGIFSTEDEPDISKLTEKITCGRIKFDRLGSFEPRVFYAAPEKSDYLKNCNDILYEWIRTSGYKENKLYANDSWIPHLTIAIKLDSEQLQKAFSAADFTPFSGRAEKFALIKCSPYREVACYDL